MQEEKNEFQTCLVKHTTTHTGNLTPTGQNLKFHIVPDSFPLKEDGIFGLPLLQKYDYQITNPVLRLDKNCTSRKNQNPNKIAPHSINLSGQLADESLFHQSR